MSPLLPVLALFSVFVQLVQGYQVLVTDQDEVRQVCSGMYGSGGAQEPYIEVLFSPSSRGQLALAFFEWDDAQWLGVGADGQGGKNDWSADRIYICTVEAQAAGLCTTEQLGLFLTAPGTPAETSISTSSVRFDAVPSASGERQTARGPFRYDIGGTGYYCVATVPLLLEGATRNTSFTGVVDFENVFSGHLPAAEYPKVTFYKVLFFVYLGTAVAWCALCYVYRRDLLPLQRYITAVVGLLVVEHLFTWLYWRYLNQTGHPGVAGAYLFVGSTLNAARNSVSLYLLTIASMGLSVVRPSLGSAMAKVRLLAIFHFTFGLLYSVGSATIPLSSTVFFVFFFVLPLSVTLTVFLMWVLYSLSSTISDLNARRQKYKRTMFVRLYYILVVTSTLILLFFVASSIAFSSRLSPSFPARTWQTRWLLLDGWLSILFAAVFFAVAFLWRPVGSNRRLSLSDEVPLDEADAEMYDLEDELLADEDRDDDDDDSGGDGKNSHAMRRVKRDSVGEERRDGAVFHVGSDDDDDDDDDDTRSAADSTRHSNAWQRRSQSGEHARRSSDSARLLHGRASEDDDEEEDRDITSQHALRGAGEAPPAYPGKKDEGTYKDD
ncbi:uncharacterized protein RHOBADRAFT_56014 [Rhodotorula graminis WP1]|uniref:Intimal thickness related receptor IRP domain-containing protein n=1 Tax=Rhodotorula graminis (strain WP1) TaxID=578459 RepID=A0A0P9ES83_RHOGW|nr:uncharacterized protein RHOBADRAFT_56014 [Rhodotorula graminis WP1]KPV72192.1 hypothetical protein RHOBADRAFT_56014 [Rhodotorula graminis WP1]